jgi:class 3 adenylate cyclase
MDEVNRRLAGILAADVVGYSAKMGADDAKTLARVRTLRTEVIEPLAATHGGRLFKNHGRRVSGGVPERGAGIALCHRHPNCLERPG